jgi:hypothetical protein
MGGAFEGVFAGVRAAKNSALIHKQLNAIAEGLKRPLIQETHLEFPDCIYVRPGASHVADGVITDMSIGYEVVDFGQDNKTGIRTLKEIRLYEFGPVDFGANEQAVITGVKSLADSIIGNQRIDPAGLAAVRRELKSLLDALDKIGSGEPGKPTPPDGPSIDTRLAKLPEELTARLAAAFRLNN